ncbi:Acetyltransferase (GNAT) family protein [Quadrisphaera granulorum]|uniref:Acetyltransferase (GNAT) family protein n=1 Tax=Quadrisphaera granulorum TaxID=317664 RepID=A0A316A8F8_9ACTN|nr:GNAT family N-acetyltransferase [Quadrisphaera granulorum]PWJ54025.1 acetyltransferase (GNAT) family protein [Quadrisphaera granulorum]SZE96482.1 Acetyltransferase (GNAT) family protein [Quadrisphaera granulorum]
MGVRLVVVGPDDDALLAAASRLRISAEQQRFAAVPADSFPLAFADPARTPFVVVASDDDGHHDDDGEVVGAGVLHTGTADPDQDAELARLLAAAGEDPATAVLLRSVVIGADHQGRGFGTAAARAAVALAPEVARGSAGPARVVVLTVNECNHAGLRAYARAGFTDIGQYLGGSAGPQRAMIARCGSDDG